MIYYINIALSFFLVFFVLSQLKAESRITQNHFTGDWRQRLYYKLYPEDHKVFFCIVIQLVFMLSVLTILATIHKLNHNYSYISLFSDEFVIIDIIIDVIPMIIALYVFPPFLGVWPTIMIIAIVAPIISNFIYYNPEGKHCLVKSKSSGKYTIYSFNYKLPNPDYILQHLGESNNSEFNSKQEVLNAILKLDNRDNIMSKLSNKD